MEAVNHNNPAPSVDVSIIIVNYNTYKMTSECIDSVFKKTSGITFEIIVVDNASSDESKNGFEKDQRIVYVYNNENLGFGKANNIGLKQVNGRNIIFLNSDTLLINNAIKVLSDYLDTHIDVGICGGNLYDADNQPTHSYQMYYPSIKEEVNEIFHCIPTTLLKRDRTQYNTTGAPKDVCYVTGADLMIKKALLDIYGAFNPVFFMYFEETELCHRIRTAGYRIVSVPDAKIIHLCGKSTKKTKKNIMYMESKKKYYEVTHKCIFLRKIFLFLTTLH